MREKQSFVLLFTVFFGCFLQENTGEIMLFPRETSTDHVVLKSTLEKPLKQFTLCLHSYTELTRPHSLFSLATSGKDNTVLIFQLPPDICAVYINQEKVSFKVDPEVLDWKSTCVSWDSKTGLLQLWINGKRYPRKVTTTRSPIPSKMSIILGQEQDNFGGGFDAKQSFIGEICNVNMWDYVLPPETISLYCYSRGNRDGNFIGWQNGSFVSKGNANILRNEFCPCYST